MDKINLISPELSVGGATNKVANGLKQISLVGGVLAVFTALVLLGFSIFYSFQTNKIANNTDVLKQQINSLKQSEQKLIFAKDRLGKISEVRAQETAYDELQNFNYLYGFLKTQPDIRISEVSMDPSKLEISFLSSTLSSITEFFKFLDSDKKKFEKVEINSFIYNPSSGYLVSLVFEKDEKK